MRRRNFLSIFSSFFYNIPQLDNCTFLFLSYSISLDDEISIKKIYSKTYKNLSIKFLSFCTLSVKKKRKTTKALLLFCFIILYLKYWSNNTKNAQDRCFFLFCLCSHHRAKSVFIPSLISLSPPRFFY